MVSTGSHQDGSKPYTSEFSNVVNNESIDTVLQVGAIHGDVILRSVGRPSFSAVQNLPRDQALFTGRFAELDAATRDPGERVVVVAIDGMAGVGKTTLAVHAAHTLASRFPDGQIFIRLHGHTPGRHPVSTLDSLASLLEATGLTADQIPETVDSRESLWRTRVANQKILLILDDAINTAQVLPLLPASRGTLVLVTSRTRLYALPDAQPISLGVLRPSEAAELFVRLTGRSDVLVSDDGMVELIRTCGGLPLAISVLAGQMKHHSTWTTASLASELAASADQLSSMRAENISVAAAFDLSYRRLSSDRRKLFRRLGLHPGDEFDAYAAAALDDGDVHAAAAALDALYTHHMIEESSRGRYRFHDLLRWHARSLAVAEKMPDQEEAIGRVLDYYRHASQVASHVLPGRPSATSAKIDSTAFSIPPLASVSLSTAWLNLERFNLQAAATLAVRSGRLDHAVAIPLAMAGYLQGEGHWDQASALYDIALLAARNAADVMGEAAALVELGTMLRLRGEYGKAVVHLQQASRVYADARVEIGLANAKSELARVQFVMGNCVQAQAGLEWALVAYRKTSSQLGEANALDDLCFVRRMIGNYDAARRDACQAFELYSEIGDLRGQASALDHRGFVERLMGDFGAADRSFGLALRIYRDVGELLGEANVLSNLGYMYSQVGEYDKAVVSLDRALICYRSLGNRVGEGNVLHYRGVLHAMWDEFDAAVSCLKESLETYRDIGTRRGEANSLNDLGFAFALAGKVDLAQDSLNESLRLSRMIGNRLCESNVLSNLGVLAMLRGDCELADQFFEQALKIHRELGDRYNEARTLNNMGDLCRAQSAAEGAGKLHELARVIAESIGALPEEARALEGIGRSQLKTEGNEYSIELLRQALAAYVRVRSPRVAVIEALLMSEA